MEEVLLRLKELLFPSIADVAVLSVDVNIAIVRVDAQYTGDGAVCPVCGARYDERARHCQALVTIACLRLRLPTDMADTP
ncbi:hypothetical protein [Streptomyces durocortorensis]|uniref:Transposase n=1 Tax=Streptomyces durocortorensis TaxID=2811104 RepID=A0ABS2I728_9ACTN|nr:hypothetical protein [Streptomyces durocortorensis]MBM7057603.1 hypothetical protein [Streptomyces durocortorensis]